MNIFIRGCWAWIVCRCPAFVCSATRENQAYGFENYKADHVDNYHYTDIGYHYYVECDGTVREECDLSMVETHCLNHNRFSLGMC